MPEEFKCGARKVIWVHAVSVGEVLAAKPFIEALKDTFPDYRVIVSTTTKTGNDTAKSVLKGTPVFYFPLDLSFIVNKVIAFTRPRLFIVFETEIWPNLISALHRKKIPIALVNGRISDKSYRGYKLIKFIFAGVLRKISLFLMQTNEDAARVISIGAPSENVKVMGNVKYDLEFKEISFASKEALRENLGVASGDPVIICGSTHNGEEEIMLRVFRKISDKFKNTRLIIAPRHIERSSEIMELIAKMNLKAARLSEIASAKDPDGKKPVIVVDTMGRLREIYSIGTAVFVGGSMVKRGGHNIAEPAIFKKAIVFGPYMNNFRDMAERFLKRKAAVMAHDERELVGIVDDILANPKKREAIGEAAFAIITENKGAVQKAVGYIGDMDGYVKVNILI